MKIKYLLVLLILGCANKTPTYSDKPLEPIRRVSATKDDLLYNYSIGLGYPNGFEKVEANATEWCKRKYNLGAVPRTQSQCSVYPNPAGDRQVCTVSFKCQ